jgi:hypothetical protein
MKCPSEIGDIVLAILQRGLLRIRAFGWAGDDQRCAIEADHLHNLPALLTHFSSDMLRYYWEVERPSFQSQSEGQSLTEFEALWDQLAPWAASQEKPALVPRAVRSSEPGK